VTCSTHFNLVNSFTDPTSGGLRHSESTILRPRVTTSGSKTAQHDNVAHHGNWIVDVLPNGKLLTARHGGMLDSRGRDAGRATFGVFGGEILVEFATGITSNRRRRSGRSGSQGPSPSRGVGTALCTMTPARPNTCTSHRSRRSRWLVGDIIPTIGANQCRMLGNP